MVGRQTPILAVFVPLILVLMVDGRRGVRQTWLAALVGGLAFAVAQFLSSNYFNYQVADIIAALAGALAIVLLLRVWQPSEIVTADEPAPTRQCWSRSRPGGPTGRSPVAAARAAPARPAAAPPRAPVADAGPVDQARGADGLRART